MKSKKASIIDIVIAFLFLGFIVGVGTTYVFAGKTTACQEGDHDYKVSIVKHATQTQDGERRFVCRDCGSTYTQKIPSMGHHWSAWTVLRDATPKAEGLKQRTCSHCGSKATATLPRLPDKKPSAPSPGKDHEVVTPGGEDQDSSNSNGGEASANSTIEDTPDDLPDDVNAEPDDDEDTDLLAGVSDSSGNGSGTGSGAGGDFGGQGKESVPLGAVDAIIVGANGLVLLYWIILILPLLKVLHWIAAKRREKSEEAAA